MTSREKAWKFAREHHFDMGPRLETALAKLLEDLDAARAELATVHAERDGAVSIATQLRNTSSGVTDRIRELIEAWRAAKGVDGRTHHALCTHLDCMIERGLADQPESEIEAAQRLCWTGVQKCDPSCLHFNGAVPVACSVCETMHAAPECPMVGDVWRGTAQHKHQEERTLYKAVEDGAFQTTDRTVIDAESFRNGDFVLVRRATVSLPVAESAEAAPERLPNFGAAPSKTTPSDRSET